MAEIPEVQLQMLQNGVEKVFKDVVRAQQCSSDFVISVSELMDSNVVIKAGYPPVVVFDSGFLSRMLMEPDEKTRGKMKKHFRRIVSSAVSKLPMMERTLAMVPIAEAIAMREGFRKWFKTNDPSKLVYEIPDAYIREEETYTITLTELNTQHSVTLSGDNPTILRKKAREKLTRLVASSELLAQKIKEEKESNIVYDDKPVSIEITINPNTDAEEVRKNF